MQLANKAFVAARLGICEVLGLFVVYLRSSAGWRRQYAAMAMDSFYGCTVKNEDNQQQTKPAFKLGAVVLKSFG